MFIKLFKWIINLLVVAIPFSFLVQILFFYNIFFNFRWNQMWAGGNVYLLANTAYCFF